MIADAAVEIKERDLTARFECMLTVPKRRIVFDDPSLLIIGLREEMRAGLNDWIEILIVRQQKFGACADARRGLGGVVIGHVE